MNLPEPIRNALIALLLVILGWLGYEATTSEPTEPEPIGSIRGLVYTAAADGLIQQTGAPVIAEAGKVFDHFRYMGVAERMYALDRGGRVEQKPLKAGPVQPCTNTSNVWACPTPSFREDLSRLVTLRDNHSGVGVYVAEWFAGKTWPAKMVLPWEVLPPALLNLEPGSEQQKRIVEQEAYEAAKAVFASIASLPGDWIVEPKNEWWERRYLWLSIEWTRGYIRAHRELSPEVKQKVRFSLGPIAGSDRSWQGSTLAESVENYPADILDYIDEVGGYWSYHFYVSDPATWNFPARDKVMDAPEWGDLEKVVSFRDKNYPNTKIYVGEWGYTSSAPNVLPTSEQIQGDAPVIRAIEKRLGSMVDGPLFLYQIAEHAAPEGKFTGTAWLTNRAAFQE